MAFRSITRQQQPAPASPSGTIVGAAERLADRLASQAGQTVGESWQHLALEMYDALPELRTAARITSQAMSQCRLVIARTSGGSTEPAPLDIGTIDKPGPDANHPAQKLLEAFAGGQGGQSAYLDMLGVHLTVTGESISIGALDTTAQNDHILAPWATYSPNQVVSRNKKITVKLGNTIRTDELVDEENDGITAVRIWRPHPRFSWQADSAARAALGVMQEIILFDQHIEASAISRLISAGLLLVPDGMSLPGMPAADDSADQALDPFMRFMIQVMSTAIRDRQSAAARVPIVIRGDADDIAAFKHLVFSTPFDDKVHELRTAAITRLSIAVDMPPEYLTGLGKTHAWSAATVTADWVNNYLPTLMSLACGSLTSGWLHRALAATQGTDDYSDLIVWFDSSSVRVRENQGPEMQWAWENGLIKDDTARRTLGFDESDKPSEGDSKHGLLIKILERSPVLAPLIFPILGIKLTDEQLIEADRLAQALNHSLILPGLYTPGAPDPTQALGNPAQHPTGTPKPTVGIPVETQAKQPRSATSVVPVTTAGPPTTPRPAPVLAR